MTLYARQMKTQHVLDMFPHMRGKMEEAARERLAVILNLTRASRLRTRRQLASEFLSKDLKMPFTQTTHNKHDLWCDRVCM